MRLIVTGADSMLAKHIAKRAREVGHEVVPLTRQKLDLLGRERLVPVLERALAGEALPPLRERPLAGEGAAVVNCGAYTAVDRAEEEPALAFAINGQGAQNLAEGCASLALPLLHLSSDYVFSGYAGDRVRATPYTESDRPDPRSVYGHTKLAGEEAVLAASPQNTVVRTAWLYGLYGPNFVATMLALGKEQGRVRVVADQVGCPTWCGHLAAALVGLLEREVQGLVHLAGSGATSWYVFAREIFRQAELAVEVEPITTAQAGRPAPRPPYSVLASEREDVIPLPPWQDGLSSYLAARAEMMQA